MWRCVGLLPAVCEALESLAWRSGIDIIYARPFEELPDVASLRHRPAECFLGAVTAALVALSLAGAGKASEQQLAESFSVASELMQLMFRRPKVFHDFSFFFHCFFIDFH